MNREEFKKEIELHQLWLSSKTKEGKKAVFKDCKFWGFDIQKVDLRYSSFEGCLFYDCKFIEVDLSNSVIQECDFSYTKFENCKLKFMECEKNLFLFSIFENSILTYTNFYNCDFTGADLTSSILKKTNFVRSHLIKTVFNDEEKVRTGIILKEKIIGYIDCEKNTFATIEIPKGAIVFSNDGVECRTNKAKVLEISDGEKSAYDLTTNRIYKLGHKYNIEDFSLIYDAFDKDSIVFYRNKELMKMRLNDFIKWVNE